MVITSFLFHLKIKMAEEKLIFSTRSSNSPEMRKAAPLRFNTDLILVMWLPVEASSSKQQQQLWLADQTPTKQACWDIFHTDTGSQKGQNETTKKDIVPAGAQTEESFL